jgi:type II secretory pathway pseudopilin PulG
MRPRRGWLLLEVLGSMFIITLLAAVLFTASEQDRKGLDRLSDSRAAARVAEAALTMMQSGQSPAASDDAARISIHPLSQPADLPKLTWVQVHAVVGRDQADIVGLVPVSSVAGATQPAGGNR